jgi:hypothetical protein
MTLNLMHMQKEQGTILQLLEGTRNILLYRGESVTGRQTETTLGEVKSFSF